jgi:hypothetical protein
MQIHPRLKKMLLERLDEPRMIYGLRKLRAGTKLESMFRLFLQHRFSARETVRDIIENWQGTQFELQHIVALWNQHKTQTLHQLLHFVDLSPKVSGPAGLAVSDEERTVEGLEYMNYSHYLLDDGMHLVVHATVDQDRYRKHWQYAASHADIALLNQIYVYRCVDGSWHNQENKFADDYRDAYLVMTRLSG